MTEKMCRACGETKKLSEFNRNAETADGYRYTCKLCRKNKVPTNPAIAKTNRFPTRQYSTRKSREGVDPIQAKRAQKYGLTVTQVEQMYCDQDGYCPICKNMLPLRFHIDHDHSTGKVRGLLCSKCNVGLGQFGDDSSLLLAAIAYLQR